MKMFRYAQIPTQRYALMLALLTATLLSCALVSTAEAGLFRDNFLRHARRSGWGYGAGYHTRSTIRTNAGLYHSYTDVESPSSAAPSRVYESAPQVVPSEPAIPLTPPTAAPEELPGPALDSAYYNGR